MFKQNRATTVLSAALVLSLTIFATPASAEPEIYQAREQMIRAREMHNNKIQHRAIRLPNGDSRPLA